MKPSVYIETTIPRFYHEIRTDPDKVARRECTRDWWDNHRSKYDLFTSDAVIDELERVDFPAKDDALALILQVMHYTWLLHQIINAISFSHGTAATLPTPTSSLTSDA